MPAPEGFASGSPRLESERGRFASRSTAATGALNSENTRRPRLLRLAGRLRENVLGGADPIADRRRLADAERSVPPTVGVVFGKYAEYHLEKLADGKRRSAQLRTALDKFRASPVTQLKQSDLQAIIDAKARVAPVAANRLKAALVHFVNWSRKRGYILEPIAAEVEAPTKEQPRDRVLSLAEIGAIWRASTPRRPALGQHHARL